MMDFLQYIEKTNSAKTSDEIFYHFELALGALGFDLILMSLMTEHPSIGKPAGHGIIRNYPDDWMKHYSEKGYVEVDPVVKQVMLTTHPFMWDKLNAKGMYSKEQETLMHEAQDAGLKCGVGLGIHCANREIAGFGFASSDGTAEINKNVMSLVKAITSQFHAAYTDHERKYGQAHPAEMIHITPAQKDILQYMRFGKSNSEIADILNISSHTVDYHVRNLFAKLDANNRVYAVCKAIRFGWINP